LNRSAPLNIPKGLCYFPVTLQCAALGFLALMKTALGYLKFAVTYRRLLVNSLVNQIAFGFSSAILVVVIFRLPFSGDFLHLFLKRPGLTSLSLVFVAA